MGDQDHRIRFGIMPSFLSNLKPYQKVSTNSCKNAPLNSADSN